MIGRTLAITAAVLLGLYALLFATEAGVRLAAAVATSATDGRLELLGGHGRLVEEFGFDSIRYTDPGATVEIDELRIRLDWDNLLSGRVHARMLEIRALRVTTRPQPEPANPEPLTLEAPIPITVDDGKLGTFSLLDRNGERQWGLEDAKFALAWKGKWFEIDELSATTAEAGGVSLQGRLGISEGRLRFRKVHVEGPGTLDLAGDAALDEAASSRLQISWKSLRWPGLDAVNSRSGDLAIEGPWRNYGWKLKAEVTASGVDAEVDGRGRGSLDGLSVHRVEVAVLEGMVSGQGSVDWTDGLRADLDAQVANLNPETLHERLKGVVNGHVRFAGRWQGEVPHIDFEAQLKDSELRGYPLALDAKGSTEAKQVFLESLTLTSGRSRLVAAGQVLPEFNLKAELDSPDLRALWAGLSGSAKLKAAVSGSPESPRLSATGSAQDIAYAAGADQFYAAGSAKLSTVLDLQSESEVSLQLEDLEIGVALKRLAIHADGSERRHRLRLETEGAVGTAVVEVAGGVDRKAWRGTLQRLQLVQRNGNGNGIGESRWSQEDESALRVSDAGFSLEPTCLTSGRERVCVEAETSRDRQTFATRIEQLDLRHLRNWLPADWDIEGNIEGTASAVIRGGEVDAILADLRGSAGQLQGGGVSMKFGEGSLQIGPDGERLHARLRLSPAAGRIEGDIWLAPGNVLLDRPLNGQLEIALPDLSWLPVLTPEVTSASGSLDANLELSGSIRSPSAAGAVNVTDGRILLTTPGIELTELEAHITSSESAVLGVSLRAKSGGGPLLLTGGIDQLRPELAGRFSLTGQDAQWIRTPEARAWVTPNLDLVLAGPDSTLTGEIVVPKARITPREIASTGVSPSPDQVIVNSQSPPPTRGLRLTSEVRIVLGDDVRINGLGLKTRLAGAIDASDRPGRSTRGRGELRTVGGRYRAYGQDLTIETGRLLFTGGPVSDPGIDLSAYRQPDEDIRVGLRARGTLAAPKFSLYSDPAMSQEEQLSWLVLGRPLNETLQSGQRTELDNAATSLGFAGGEYLANRLLAPRLGVDEVSVGTRPGQTNEQARLTVGKYLSPRLFVSYGFGLFQPGRFLRMQYDLGGGFKLSGESGVEQSGDLIYTFER